MRVAGFILGCAVACTADAAELGDSRENPGEIQAALVPGELIPPAPALSPQEAMKTFRLAPGFELELVASDPLIGDPVSMTIGPDGRLWVVEMRSYMPGLDGQGEDAPVGRVVILEDTDGDGRMDRRTVFKDHLIMPRALMLVGNGALIGAPPKLWHCRDTNGDGQADATTEVASDYGVQVDPKRPEIANPENAPNSLLWAVDNWIYSAQYSKRFRFDDGEWITDSTAVRGQWGLSQDDDGHLFYNSNSDQLRADVLPSRYLWRNPNLRRPSGVTVKVATEQFVWPVRVNPGINRGYQTNMLREGKLKEFTAACAPWIYRGNLFEGEFYGNAFVCEPAGNLIKRNILSATQGTLRAREAYRESEFLASKDERFRPVNLYTGPEGALYIVDMYRGVIQHRISLTTYLRKQAEERHLDKPIGLGRIYRVVPVGKSPVVKPRLLQETPEQWVAHLSRENSWWRETAQRLLIERNDSRAVPALTRLAATGASPLGRLHALWTLEGMGRLDSVTAATALGDLDARVRAVAVRVCEPFLKSGQRLQVLPKLIAMTAEPSPLVQQHLALILGEANDKEADLALATLVRNAPGTEFLRDAAVSGLFGRELELLEHLVADKAWNHAGDHGDQFLGSLAGCIFNSRRVEAIEQLLTLMADRPMSTARKLALLDGILAAAPTARARKPVKLMRQPATLEQSGHPNDSNVTARVAEITALLMWPGKRDTQPEPVVPPLTAAEQARFDLGRTLYGGVCAPCHQPHGLGQEGMAPPLADSEWVLGSEQRLIRIVLHGVSGRLKVLDRTYWLDMPALGVLSDDQIAAILTYIRREWEHTAGPVDPSVVKSVRIATKARDRSWTESELMKIP